MGFDWSRFSKHSQKQHLLHLTVQFSNQVISDIEGNVYLDQGPD